LTLFGVNSPLWGGESFERGGDMKQKWRDTRLSRCDTVFIRIDSLNHGNFWSAKRIPVWPLVIRPGWGNQYGFWFIESVVVSIIAPLNAVQHRWYMFSGLCAPMVAPLAPSVVTLCSQASNHGCIAHPVYGSKMTAAGDSKRIAET